MDYRSPAHHGSGRAIARCRATSFVSVFDLGQFRSSPDLLLLFSAGPRAKVLLLFEDPESPLAAELLSGEGGRAGMPLRLQSSRIRTGDSGSVRSVRSELGIALGRM